MLLETRNLRGGLLKGVDLSLHAGEIVGVAGLEGQGQQALLRLPVGRRQARRPTVLTHRAAVHAVRTFIESIDDYQLQTTRVVHVMSDYQVPADLGLERACGLQRRGLGGVEGLVGSGRRATGEYGRYA